MWAGAPPELLAERVADVAAWRPWAMGACAITPVAGADVGGRRPASRDELRLVAAVARLACGEAVPVGGIGGVAWVDAGCDPRARSYGETDAHLRRQIARARERLRADGFAV